MSMIEQFGQLVQASSYAGDIDFLFDLITYIVGFWFILTELVLFYFIFAYRRKEGVKAAYISGDTHKEQNWIEIPHYLVILCDIVLIVGTVMVWVKVKQDLPEKDYKVRIIAQQWAWTFVHPGPDGKLDTEDDISTVNEMNLEVDKTYHYELETRDVLHSFSVPVFRLKQDAVPGRRITGWFKPTKTTDVDKDGKEQPFIIQCAEMCGVGHGLMPANLFIRSSADHKKWIAKASGHSSTVVASQTKTNQGLGE